MKEWVDQ